MQKKPHPFPIFDKLSNLKAPLSSWHKQYFQQFNALNITDEYNLCKQFLLAYKGSEDTFKSYRREVERLCQWSWLIRKSNIRDLDRKALAEYFDFVQRPCPEWIATQHAQRYTVSEDGSRLPSEEWRPFLIRSKDKKYRFSQSSLRACMASVSTFFTYLVQESYVQHNPVSNIRQKSQFLQKVQTQRVTRKLSDQQWRVMVDTIEKKVASDDAYTRHWFVITAFFLLGLRISELAETPQHHPVMGDFFRDSSDRWWFKTIGKGNKYREVAVPDAMLHYLKQYRQHLGLSGLPGVSEQTPLIPKTRGNGGIGVRQLRKVVQEAFNLTIEALVANNQAEEAELMLNATVHWLRHTAISHDVTHRPREHVRDDAGHRSVSVTDRYIEIDLEARHNSARHKNISTKK